MKHNIEYYLSNGFDQKAAEYFASGVKRIVSVSANDDFSLTIDFDNGETRLYDVKPFIKEGTVMAFLADIDNFKRVYLDAQHAIAWDIDPNVNSEEVWNNKVDLCPDTCYMDSVPLSKVKSA